MASRRTQYEIFWEILMFCKKKQTFTAIIRYCNLNSKITQDYLDFLLKKEYISIIEHNNKKFYLTTDKSEEFIALFTNLYKELFETSLQKNG